MNIITEKYKYSINELTHTFEITGLNGELVISLQMDEELDQVIISTPKEVYAGPVELIRFKEDV